MTEEQLSEVERLARVALVSAKDPCGQTALRWVSLLVAEVRRVRLEKAQMLVAFGQEARA